MLGLPYSRSYACVRSAPPLDFHETDVVRLARPMHHALIVKPYQSFACSSSWHLT